MHFIYTFMKDFCFWEFKCKSCWFLYNIHLGHNTLEHLEKQGKKRHKEGWKIEWERKREQNKKKGREGREKKGEGAKDEGQIGKKGVAERT